MKTFSLQEAIGSVGGTRCVEISPGALATVPPVFRRYFEKSEAVIVADPRTFAAAGSSIQKAFRSAGLQMREPQILNEPDLHADMQFVEQLEATFRMHKAVPIAVGSGTINDLVKYAAHRLERQYMCVGTAASMDGYTAYGASITIEGVKQTVFCPAPVAVVADVDVICRAPGLMNSWGYADLLAKVPAGADWILADALKLDPLHPTAWSMAQGRLHESLGNPAGVRNHEPGATTSLLDGLMMGGFAIEAAQSTRAASGAEHLFSHVWDMQHHTHDGSAPSHGFKVAIGTLASAALYERLLARDVAHMDVPACVSRWPELDNLLARARQTFGDGPLMNTAARELAAKYCTRAELRDQLEALKSMWPDLSTRLRAQLGSLESVRRKLQEAGAPVEPEQIGISRERLRETYWQASFIRRRFMVLDLATRLSVLEECLDEIFGPEGLWPLRQT